ncbi:transposase [Streptomyces sp. NPDC088115]|uniref:transposase n=1 Tax=Streptomyces sp. NPDC088115 TaxID=3365824 RepID=UPI0038013A36
MIDGIRFRVRTGVPWRDVPVEYGPWGRVYDQFRQWQRAASGSGPSHGSSRWRTRRVRSRGTGRRFHRLPRPSACGGSPQAE